MRSRTGPEEPPLISVLLPVRDAAATLEACLRSLLRQSERRWECIVVDDGSTDGSREWLRGLSGREPRLRLVCRSGGGIVAALNAGLGRCRGRYVARMDADDLMHRRRLAEQLELLESRPDLVGVGCHVRRFPRRSLTEGARAYERWLNAVLDESDVRRECYVECPLAHPTLMLRKATLLRWRYRDCGWPEDYDLVLRLLGHGAKLGVLPRRRLAWRDGPQRLSRTSEIYHQRQFTRCKAAFLADGFLASTSSYDLWGYGSTGRALCAALAAHDKHPRRIIELHPGRLGQRIRGAEVVSPDRLTDAPRLPLLVSVAGAGPRGEIRAALAERNYRETHDYYCAA